MVMHYIQPHDARGCIGQTPGRRETAKERVDQMTTETRTTKVVTTETTTTIKSEQVQTVLVSDKVGQGYEPHYGLFCGCQLAIVIRIIVCVHLAARSKLARTVRMRADKMIKKSSSLRRLQFR